MNTLQYKVIKTGRQYNQYCKELEDLVMLKKKSKDQKDIIDLLTLLIEKWDDDHSSSVEMHPIELLKQLMDIHDLNAASLSKNTGIDKTILSKIINHKKGFSKDVIRTLANYFKVRQEAFNRPFHIIELEKSASREAKGSK